MPAYPWLFDAKADQAIAGDKMAVLKKLGTPYSAEQLQAAAADYKAQAATVIANLASRLPPR